MNISTPQIFNSATVIQHAKCGQQLLQVVDHKQGLTNLVKIKIERDERAPDGKKCNFIPKKK